MGKGRYSKAAARQFEKELGHPIDKWHCVWDEEDEPMIPGTRGHLYVYGKDKLGVSFIGFQFIQAKAMIKRANTVLGIPEQWGDWEANWCVSPELLEPAATIVKAYKHSQRTMTPEQKARNAKILARARAQRATTSPENERTRA